MWILNPLTHSLFVPLASTLGGLLSVGLLGVLAGRGLTTDQKLKKDVLLRWFSWLLISIVGLTSVLSGALAIATLTAAVALLGTLEYCRISKSDRDIEIVLCSFAVFAPFVTMINPSYLPLLLFLGLSGVSALGLAKAKPFDQIALSALGVFYVPFLASHFVALYQLPSAGAGMVLAVIASSALSNIFAFIFGKAFKGPKLASAVSPNKTWSGAVGSVFGAFIGFHLISLAASLPINFCSGLLIPLMVAIFGILGDLFESSLKRHFAVKDAGNWLPGFGGALDRIDGLLFVVPSVYYVTMLLSGG